MPTLLRSLEVEWSTTTMWWDMQSPMSASYVMERMRAWCWMGTTGVPLRWGYILYEFIPSAPFNFIVPFLTHFTLFDLHIDDYPQLKPFGKLTYVPAYMCFRTFRNEGRRTSLPMVTTMSILGGPYTRTNWMLFCALLLLSRASRARTPKLYAPFHLLH